MGMVICGEGWAARAKGRPVAIYLIPRASESGRALRRAG